ncbi:ribosome small subunit-dependent GTPase A [Candidatus Margulisiibacteriota bacterium]
MNNDTPLASLGWDNFFEDAFKQLGTEGLVPARVIRQNMHIYLAQCAEGVLRAEVSGKLRNDIEAAGGFPAVGDWVAIQPLYRERQAVIHAVLPRKSKFSRKAAGRTTEEQIVAANIDTGFLISGLDHDFNPRRIERYVTLAWNSGASPVVVLNKSDLVTNIDERIVQAEQAAPGVPVISVSALSAQGLDQLLPYLAPEQTVAFLGSSGAGKSTLINTLLGEERLAVSEVREDDSRGRHTTTHRELIILPGGAMVIDTPGLREIQLWGDADDLVASFPEIEALAVNCRFRDCTHETEPGCAVLAAVESGELDSGRYQSYLKLRQELVYLEQKQTESTRQAQKTRGRHFATLHKEIERFNPKYKKL